MPSRLTPYLRVLNRNAFGNFRTLLGEITLNTAMGRYLDMVTSTRTRPNENYPREVLQLFSIGTMRRNPDGTVQSDADGPIPTYDQAIVDGFSKAFTGWTYAPQYPDGITNYIDPMVLVPGNHDTTEKLLLRGVTLPAGRTGTQDLNDALDNIFQDPNVGPFIGGQLIRMLVTSNPSPAYVARVTFAFDDNGYGVRGDMKAVIRAVLLDPEARGTGPEASSFGRLREPALWLVASLRALGARSADGTANADGYLNPRTSPLGQSVLRPPSVFSYFPPDYEAPGAGGLLGPEFGILSATTALGRANFVNSPRLQHLRLPGRHPPLPSTQHGPEQPEREYQRRLSRIRESRSPRREPGRTRPGAVDRRARPAAPARHDVGGDALAGRAGAECDRPDRPDTTRGRPRREVPPRPGGDLPRPHRIAVPGGEVTP